MNLFEKFFKSKSISEDKSKPIPGESWELFDKSPWPKHSTSITILDVKDDWVRYDMSPLFMDQRMELKSFLRIYKKVNN